MTGNTENGKSIDQNKVAIAALLKCLQLFRPLTMQEISSELSAMEFLPDEQKTKSPKCLLMK